MSDFTRSFLIAFDLIFRLDPDLLEIVGLSFYVSGGAVFIATVLGLPLGAAMAVVEFRGQGLVASFTSALMGLPPVVVGLLVYMFLSRSGPLGVFGLLYSPGAMIVAQTVLVFPVIVTLAQQAVQVLWQEYREQLLSFGCRRRQVIGTLLWEGRFRLATVVLAGLGRAMAEVGAVMIVGGNVDHLTRLMTTTIALETSKGELGLALALGIILVLLSFVVHFSSHSLGRHVHEVNR